MVSEITNTPKALRLHIGIFGAANAGKSTLINAVTGQDIAIVSEVAGTTADPVFKPMELLPLGPVVFIDTAGFDDNGELGKLRMQKTIAQIDSCDAAIFVISSKEKDLPHAKENLLKITKANIRQRQITIPHAFIFNRNFSKKNIFKHGRPPLLFHFVNKQESENWELSVSEPNSHS